MDSVVDVYPPATEILPDMANFHLRGGEEKEEKEKEKKEREKKEKKEKRRFSQC